MRERITEVLEGIALVEMIDDHRMVTKATINRYLHLATLERFQENPIGVIMPMPTVYKAPSGFACAKVADQIDALFHGADFAMLGYGTPYGRGHFFDFLQ